MPKGEIQNLIKELLEKATVKVTNISILDENSADTWFAVEVDEPHLFFSREGEAVFALNHLVRKIMENRLGAQSKDGVTELNFLVDINNFQKKRVENLRTIAHMMAERARYFKSNIEVDPMSAFERRIVHEFLSGAEDLKTESTGSGANRRVVIKYVGLS